MSVTTRHYGLTQTIPRTGCSSGLPGDDGATQYGYPLTIEERLTNNSDGTVTDRFTGLQYVNYLDLAVPGDPVPPINNEGQNVLGTWAPDTTFYEGDICSFYATGDMWCVGLIVLPGMVVSSDTDVSHYLCKVAHTCAGDNIDAEIAAHPEYWSAQLKMSRAHNNLWAYQCIAICVAEHTSSYGELVLPEYADETYYDAGTWVLWYYYGSPQYTYCLVAHTSNGSTLLDDASNNPGTWWREGWGGPENILLYDALQGDTWRINPFGVIDYSYNCLMLNDVGFNAIAMLDGWTFNGKSDWRCSNFLEQLALWEYSGTYWSVNNSVILGLYDNTSIGRATSSYSQNYAPGYLAWSYFLGDQLSSTVLSDNYVYGSFSATAVRGGRRNTWPT